MGVQGARKKRRLLAIRDGLDCSLCGKRMDFSTPHNNADPWKEPGARIATIDHVIPVSQGGTDDMSNLRLACLRCNQLEGIRMEAWRGKYPREYVWDLGIREQLSVVEPKE